MRGLLLSPEQGQHVLARYRSLPVRLSIHALGKDSFLVSQAGLHGARHAVAGPAHGPHSSLIPVQSLLYYIPGSSARAAPGVHVQVTNAAGGTRAPVSARHPVAQKG